MRILFCCLGLMFTTVVAATTLPKDPASVKVRCSEYAREDQVPAKDLDAYMQDCINALSEPSADDKVPDSTSPQPERD